MSSVHPSQSASQVAASNAPSKAESQASQIDTKLRANQTKAKLRQLLKNIDTGNVAFNLTISDKQGKVKCDAFYTILKLHGIELSERDQSSLTARYGNGGQIKYKEALQDCQIDLNSAAFGDERWTLARSEARDNSSQVGSVLTSKALSTLSKKSARPDAPTQVSDKFSQKDLTVKTPSVVQSQAAVSTNSKQHATAMNKSYPMKNQLDFPNYQTGEVTKFVEGQEGVVRQNYNAPSKAQIKQMATYITDLITNDRESFDQLVLLLRYLSQLDVDLRQLSQLRAVYFNKEKKQLKAVSFEELQTAMMGIFHHYRQCAEISERIIAYLKSKKDLTDAPYERVNTMIEFV